MDHIISRIGIQAAYKTAQKLYPTKTHQQCVEEVAYQLCISVEAVEEALKAETLHE